MSTDMDTTTPTTTARATLRTYARPATVGWAVVRDHVRLDGSQCPKSGTETTRRDGPDALPICIDGCPDSVDRRNGAALITQAHAALEASSRIDHVEMQSPPIVFRHAAKVLREWDGKRVALLDYIVAVRAAIAADHVEACIEDSARRIANLTSEYFDDGMIEQFIAGATEPCPKCGELILSACGRHLAKHAEVTR